MFRQFKNIMLKGIMLFALFCILPVLAAHAADNEEIRLKEKFIARVTRILKMQWR